MSFRERLNWQSRIRNHSHSEPTTLRSDDERADLFFKAKRAFDALSSTKHYNAARKVAAVVGPTVGLAMILNGVRKTEGFNPMKHTLSDTMENGISFSLGTLISGTSTVLLSRLLREQDPNCRITRIGAVGLEITGYAIGAVGLSKWVFKEEHDNFAGFYFLGSPVFLSILGLDELRHGSKPMAFGTLLAIGGAVLSFVVGYNKKENTIPATFETSHAISLGLWSLGIGISKFLLHKNKRE